jgi:hypothetical protein
MLMETKLRGAALSWIKELPAGTKFTFDDVYDFLETEFPKECSKPKKASRAPRYKHYARGAMCDAMPERLGLIKTTGIPGERLRV